MIENPMPKTLNDKEIHQMVGILTIDEAMLFTKFIMQRFGTRVCLRSIDDIQVDNYNVVKADDCTFNITADAQVVFNDEDIRNFAENYHANDMPPDNSSTFTDICNFVEKSGVDAVIADNINPIPNLTFVDACVIAEKNKQSY